MQDCNPELSYREEARLLRDKYMRALEANDKLREEIKLLNQFALSGQRQEIRVASASVPANSELAVTRQTNRPDKERRILGQFARQVEKALCKAVLGPGTRIHSLWILLTVSTEKNEIAKWTEFEKKFGWFTELTQMILDLHDSHGPASVEADQKPITRTDLYYVLAMRYGSNVLDMTDALRLVDILGSLNGASLFTKIESSYL